MGEVSKHYPQGSGTRPMRKGRGRPPLLAAGISSVRPSPSSSVRSLGDVCPLIFPFYTAHEDFSDRLSGCIQDQFGLLKGILLPIVPQELEKAQVPRQVR